MHSLLSDPEAEFSALCNAAGQSSLGQLFTQAHTLAKLSGGIVNYAALLHNADVIAHDEDRRVTRAAATRLSEHAVTSLKEQRCEGGGDNEGGRRRGRSFEAKDCGL